MNIDTGRALAKAGIADCFTCSGSGEVEVRAGDVIIPVPCPDGCEGPPWIEGHDSYPEVLNAMREEDRHGRIGAAGSE